MGIWSRTYTGLDMGAKHLKAIELVIKGSWIRTAKIGIRATPPKAYGAGIVKNPPALAEALGHLWRDYGFKSKRVVVAVGGPQILYRFLTLPRMTAAELRTALQWELEEHFPFSAQEAVFDYMPLGNSTGFEGQRERFLVVAAPRRIIDGYLEALSRAGLEAVALEPEPIALLRSLGEGEEDKLMVAAEWDYVSIIIASGAKPLFARVVPWAKNGRDKGEELCNECRRTLEYYQSRFGKGSLPREVVFYGQDHQDLLGILARALELPVRPAPAPGRGFTWNPDLAAEKRSSLALSIGLVLREVKGRSGRG